MNIFEAKTEADFDVIRAMLREYAEWMEYELCFDGFDQELASLPGRYAPPTGRILIAEIDGQPAGCIGLSRVTDLRCEMERLWVRPEFRGQKVGRRLIAKLIEEARKIGYTTICLYTTDRMEVARSMYERLGFVLKERPCNDGCMHYMELSL